MIDAPDKPVLKLTSFSVPVEGDEAYQAKIRAYASLSKKSQAAIVRHAMDSTYGPNLESFDSFFENAVASKQRA